MMAVRELLKMAVTDEVLTGGIDDEPTVKDEPAIIDDVKDVLKEFVAKTPVSGDKCLFCDGDSDPIQSVVFHPHVFARLVSLLYASDKEWGVYLVGAVDEDGDAVITDIEIPEQQVSAAQYRVVTPTTNPEAIGMIHSHVSMGAFMSSDDNERANYPLYGTISKAGGGEKVGVEITMKLRVDLPCDSTKYRMKNIAWSVMLLTQDEEELKKKTSPLHSTPLQHFGYGHFPRGGGQGSLYPTPQSEQPSTNLPVVLVDGNVFPDGFAHTQVVRDGKQVYVTIDNDVKYENGSLVVSDLPRSDKWDGASRIILTEISHIENIKEEHIHIATPGKTCETNLGLRCPSCCPLILGVVIEDGVIRGCACMSNEGFFEEELATYTASESFLPDATPS